MELATFTQNLRKGTELHEEYLGWCHIMIVGELRISQSGLLKKGQSLNQ